MIICQKFSIEFGFGTIAARNCWLVSINDITDALKKEVGGSPGKKNTKLEIKQTVFIVKLRQNFRQG